MIIGQCLKFINVKNDDIINITIILSDLVNNININISNLMYEDREVITIDRNSNFNTQC